MRVRPDGGPRPGAAVFLDRDGVLNETRGSGVRALSPRSLDELVISPDAAGSLEPLRRVGFSLLAITNQPDVARGITSREDALAITEAVVSQLGLDDAYVCLHGSSDGCECRKPLPGALLAASQAWEIDLRESWMIGDRWVDVAAGNAAGVRTVLLERPYSWGPAGGVACPSGVAPLLAVSSLAEAVASVVRLSAPESR